jgi:hypothetical protein
LNEFFAKELTRNLARSFVYCPENGAPCIQVGRELGDIIFWLKYSDELINRCASSLIRELGSELGISDIQSSKKMLLDFTSDAFNSLNANFFLLSSDNDLCVDDLLSDTHRDHLIFMFEEYISSQKKKYPYIYTLQYTTANGAHKINDNLYLYGAGFIDYLLKDINKNTGIDISRRFLDEGDIIHQPIGRYIRLSRTAAVVAYARSKDEAAELLDQFFGALCLSIDHPFKINSMTIDNRINSFDESSIITQEFRANVPSVYSINLDAAAIDKLVKILYTPNKRMSSALSFTAHGWTHDKRERFLNQFIALDALYGTEKGNKSSIVNGVCRDAAVIKDVDSKIKNIYEIRSKFVHGEISTFSNHGKYLNFVDEHGVDPLKSLFEILVACVLNYGGLIHGIDFNEKLNPTAVENK